MASGCAAWSSSTWIPPILRPPESPISPPTNFLRSSLPGAPSSFSGLVLRGRPISGDVLSLLWALSSPNLSLSASVWTLRSFFNPTFFDCFFESLWVLFIFGGMVFDELAVVIWLGIVFYVEISCLNMWALWRFWEEKWVWSGFFFCWLWTEKKWVDYRCSWFW